MAATVEIVELALGDRVVDVNRRKGKLALLRHLVEALHTGRRLLGHAAHGLQAHRVPLGVGAQLRFDGGKERALLLRARMGDRLGIALGARAQVQEQRRIPAVVEDHVGVGTVRPIKYLMRVLPVIDERLALPGEHRYARSCNRGRRMILGREDVAGSPAHLCPERRQRFDEHRRLDGHVQGATDARALQRLRLGKLLADRHETGHLPFGDRHLLAPPVGECKISHAKIAKRACGSFEVSVHRSCSLKISRLFQAARAAELLASRASSSALSVLSQENSGSVRPKCP